VASSYDQVEALWVLSSITAGDESHAKAIIEAEVLPYVVGLMGENMDVDEQVPFLHYYVDKR
jgi:hypothetical protein